MTEWTFRRRGTRFALVLAEWNPADCRFYDLWYPGYESGRLHDILVAIWYMKGGMVSGELDGKRICMLESFKSGALEWERELYPSLSG